MRLSLLDDFRVACFMKIRAELCKGSQPFVVDDLQKNIIYNLATHLAMK